MHHNELRTTVKKLIIDQGLDRPGARPDLAARIGANPNSLSMALTGLRQGPRYREILEKLQKHLLATQPAKEAVDAK